MKGQLQDKVAILLPFAEDIQFSRLEPAIHMNPTEAKVIA